MKNIEIMKQIINQLNIYRDEYYNQSNPSVSDQEYDKLFDELVELENETGIYLSNSPTQSVGYEVKSKLNKVVHNHPMLSLGKTKDINDIVKFFRYHAGVAMLKMDGLTCSVGYQQDLVSAESRGNGEVGEDLLHNAKVVTNLPLRINHDDLIVDGEMIIDYPTFEKINASMPEGSKFKNPRNLCSGSIRQLDSKIAAERGIKFIAWKCIKGIDDNDFAYRLRTLKEYGFEVVPFVTIRENPTVAEVEIAIDMLKFEAKKNGFPIDGIVFGYRDVAYGESLGMTSHHVNSQIAYKFENDVEYTTLNGIEWQVGRTGQITPVGLLETVNILDTDVSRVSLHNLKVMEDLNIKIGSTVGIIKSNEIIPMCVECDGNGDDVIIPTVCPECDYPTEIVSTVDSKVLMCNNPNCKGKLLNKLVNFCGRNGMDIEGLSEATLKLLVDRKWVASFKDLYNLNENQINLWKHHTVGFGEKSVQKLLDAIENSRRTTLDKLLTSLSIPGIGKSNAKLMMKKFGSVDFFKNHVYYKYLLYFTDDDNDEYEAYEEYGIDWTTVDGFEEKTHRAINRYFRKNAKDVLELLEELEIKVPEEKTETNANGNRLDGMNFVVTGSVNHFKNRSELQSKIEELGGKVISSVSAKTNVLINNDIDSNSSKNVKAKSLSIPIWTEEQFLEYIGGKN